jgi:hypothetical protein
VSDTIKDINQFTIIITCVDLFIVDNICSCSLTVRYDIELLC